MSEIWLFGLLCVAVIVIFGQAGEIRRLRTGVSDTMEMVEAKYGKDSTVYAFLHIDLYGRAPE